MRSKDRRYRVALEYCGHARTRLVVRFLGEWVGSADTRSGADELVRAHRLRCLIEAGLL